MKAEKVKEEKKTTINLNEIMVLDLNGDNYNGPLELVKKLSNHIFISAQSIQVSDIARELNKGQSAEVTKEELQEIAIICQSCKLWKAWVIKEINNYFKDLPFNK